MKLQDRIARRKIGDFEPKYDIVDVKNLDDVDFMTAFVGALHD